MNENNMQYFSLGFIVTNDENNQVKRTSEKEFCLYANMTKVSEYDENTKVFITFTNRYGYYIIDNMVGDSYS
jgi:hypothetical protein